MLPDEINSIQIISAKILKMIQNESKITEIIQEKTGNDKVYRNCIIILCT